MNRSIGLHRLLGYGWLVELVLSLHRMAETLKHLSTGMGLMLPLLFLHLVHQLHQLLHGQQDGTATDQPIDGPMEAGTV